MNYSLATKAPGYIMFKMTDNTATDSPGTSGHSTQERNREFYQPENLDVLTSKLRGNRGLMRLEKILRGDFRLAAETLGKPQGCVAVDCLTGPGTHVSRILEAGFGKVIGVDVSTSELARAQERFAEEGRVEFVEQDICEFFRSRPGPYVAGKTSVYRFQQAGRGADADPSRGSPLTYST